MLARVFHGAAVTSSAIAVIALGALAAITVIDVSGRYFFNRPLLGAVEMSEFLMVLVSFGALALAELRNRHITVDFVVMSLPQRVRAILDAVAALLGTLFWAFVAWRAAVHAQRVWNAGEVSANLTLPTWPFYLAVTLGCGLLALALLGRVFRSLRAGFWT